MKKVGRKIYYLKKNGAILFDTGEKMGPRVEQTSYEEDIKAAGLERLDKEGKIDVIELEYGQYKDEFRNSIYMKVNPKTKKLKFYLGDRVYNIEVYKGDREYSLDDIDYIYNEYIEFNLVEMLKVYNVSMGWFSIDDLVIRRTLLVRSWKNYYKDGFLEESAYDRTKLAKDILKNGTYWPLLVETQGDGYIVQEGNHRVISAKLLDLEGGWPKDRLFLSKIVYGDYASLKKPVHQELLEEPIKQRIPFETKFPGVTRNNKEEYKKALKYMEEQGIRFLDNKDILIEVEADTYEEFLMYNQMIPHWLRNLIYKYKAEKGIIIPPSKVVNNPSEFEKWKERHNICLKTF